MIKQILPAELHDWWEPVSADLDECRAHDKEDVWLEDIYCAIRMGQAFLYVAAVNGQYAGMMVVTRHQDQWQPSRHWLHVWYLNSRGGDEVLQEGLAFLDDLARQQGAAMITFRADKLAWERWGKKLGFKFGEIELRREIGNG
jgi:hypothetical protein